jgi:hypothetical protein
MQLLNSGVYFNTQRLLSSSPSLQPDPASSPPNLGSSRRSGSTTEHSAGGSIVLLTLPLAVSCDATGGFRWIDRILPDIFTWVTDSTLYLNAVIKQQYPRKPLHKQFNRANSSPPRPNHANLGESPHLPMLWQSSLGDCDLLAGSGIGGRASSSCYPHCCRPVTLPGYGQCERPQAAVTRAASPDSRVPDTAPYPVARHAGE